jgi:Flp pilus assembly protein TadG
VVVLFALALVPLIGMAGAAVDYTRASNFQSSLQKAADAAALVAAKGNEAFSVRQQAALSTLAQQLSAHPGVSYQAAVTPVMEGGREAAVAVSVSTAVPTTLINVLGFKSMDVSVQATATSGRNESFDVAFVLDTTGSMEGSRLASLKSATTALIDDFVARRQDPDQVRVSVIPFGQYVNVGMNNRSQPWIDVPSDYQTPTSQTCQMVREVVSQNCTQVWQPARPAQPRTCYNDGRPYQCGSPAQPGQWVNQCTPVYGPNSVQQCWTSGGDWVRWHGCVGSRAYPNETRDANYTMRIPA